MICSIHDIRPFDCRMFPLDFPEINGKDKWILWDYCSYSKQLNKTMLNKMIIDIEKNFAEQLKFLYYSGQPINKLKRLGSFQILREMNLKFLGEN
jgi:hypothetical protein